MSVHDALTLVSCAGELAMAVLIVLRGGRNPLALPMLALCVDFFAFNGADVGYRFSHVQGWVWVDVTAASMLMPIALHLALAFVGMRRGFKPLIGGAYVLFGAVALACALAFVLPVARRFAGSPAWAVMLMVGSVPLLVFVFWALGRGLRATRADLERARIVLFILAFAIGTAGCITDLVADMHVPVPRLGPVGTFLCTLLLAALVLRLRLFEQNVSRVLAVNAALLGVVQVAGYLAVFRYFGGHDAPLVVGTIAVTVAIAPALRDVARQYSASRHRLEYLATLGRFTAQMAHDLRNPLMVVKGAAQFLDVEMQREGKSSSKQIGMILQQVERMTRVIEQYQRIGRVEPVPITTDVNALVKSVVAQQSLAARAGVKLSCAAAGEVPPCAVDVDLVTAALENLVRNAFEALPDDGGEVVVRTAITNGNHPAVRVSVSDTGCGMSPWVRERALEDFFTTKASGSGLGLPFVRRVAEAHGGEVSIESAGERGTIVSFSVPCETEAAPDRRS